MFTSLRASAEYEANTSGSTYTFSPSSDIEVGDTIAMSWCGDIANIDFVSCTDNSSQPGTANDYVQIIENSGTSFTQGGVYLNSVTRKILTTDVITITISLTPAKRAAQLMAFESNNGNPRLELVTRIAGDTVSPVPLGSSGTLFSADTLVVPFHAWKGGAVASGINTLVPAGGTGCPGGGALSGGASPRVEMNGYYLLDSGGTGAITPSASYTSITMGHGLALYFSDESPAGPPLIRSVGAAGGGAFGAGLTPNFPANVQVDDLLILFIALEESANLGVGIPAGGWTEIGAQVQVTGGGRLRAFWKIQTDPFGGAPTLTWTPTTDGGETCIICIHNSTFDPASPFDLYTTGTEATVDTSFSFNVSGSHPSVDNCLAFVVYSSGFDSATGQSAGTAANTQLSPETQRASHQTAGGLGAGYTIATAPTDTNTNLGTWTATLSNATAKAYQSWVVMPPAAPPAPEELPLLAAQSNATTFYRGPLSRAFGIFQDNPPPPPPSFVPAALSRRSPFYQGQDALVALVAPNNSPDNFVALASSRRVEAYRGSYSLNVSAADEPYDVWASFTRSGDRALAPPRSVVSQVFDSPAAPAADSWAAIAQSRRHELVRARSLVVPVFDTPAVVADAWAAVYQAQSYELARGRSWASPPLSAPPPWADFNRSRLLAPYGGVSRTISVLDNPAAAADSWAAAYVSQRQERELTRSVATGVFFAQAPATPDAWAASYQSRRAPLEPTKRSAVYVPWDDHYCTTLYPDDVLGPDTMLFPDACPVLALGAVVVSRAGALYDPTLSRVTDVYDSAAVVAPAAALAVVLSRDGAYYLAPASRAIASYDSPVAPAWTPGVIQSAMAALKRYPRGVTVNPPASIDGYAYVAQSPDGRGLYLPSRSIATTPTTPLPPAQGYVPAARSRGTLPHIAAVSLAIIPFSEGIVVVTPVNQGGGGEWVIWEKPDFPGNRGDAFNKPTRRERRGY